MKDSEKDYCGFSVGSTLRALKYPQMQIELFWQGYISVLILICISSFPLPSFRRNRSQVFGFLSSTPFVKQYDLLKISHVILPRMAEWFLWVLADVAESSQTN
jgi:hypothetical protein